MPPHLKKSINQAHLGIGTYEQIVLHLEKELELNGLENPDELEIITVTKEPRKKIQIKPKNQSNLPPLQEARSLPKPLPSTQTRETPGPKQHE